MACPSLPCTKPCAYLNTPPDAPDYLEGVFNLRGKIVSVMDGKRFGEELPLRKQNRILAGRTRRQARGTDCGFGLGKY